MPARLPRSTTALAAVTGLIASGLAAIAFAPAAQAADPTPSCADGACAVSFTDATAGSRWTVPDHVTTLTAETRGAQGGGSGGGKGGSTSATFAVTPGQALTVLVGAQGSQNDKTATIGGGGAVDPAQSFAGTGGGGSFVFAANGDLLVAAGGGGGDQAFRAGGAGAGAKTDDDLGTGGPGAYVTTVPGRTYTDSGGGSQSSGGAGGTASSASERPHPAGQPGTGPAANGSAGSGGAGSVEGVGPNGSGGGGGGGYYGGGGGSFGQGGGGGSGFATPTATNVDSSTGTNAGSGSVVFRWKLITTTTSLTANPTDSADGDSVTLTAIIETNAANPTGTMVFRNGTTAITGCGNVSVDQDARAYCTTTFAAGTQNLTATYSGDNLFTGSTGSLAYSVASKPTVSTVGLADGTVDAPFSQSLSAAGGTAPYSYAVAGDTSLPAGLSLSTAGVISGTPTAAGTTNFTVRVTDSASTPRHTDKALSITLGKAAQSLTVTSNPPSSGVVDGRHDLTVTGGKSSAKVSIGSGEGTTNSACTVGTVRTPVSNGVQTANTAIYFSRVGTCSIELKQDGDSNYDAATTSYVTINVTGKPTTTTLALSASQVVHGQPVTATATVNGGDDGGTVYFYVDGKFYGSAEVEDGAATSGNLAATGAKLNGKRQVRGGAGKASGLDVGGHQVTAYYEPSDTDTFASSSAVETPLTVTPAKTTTTVKVNAKTLVATVTVNAPSEDVPTGTVTFLVGGKEVGTAEIVDGVATLDYTAPTGKAVSALYSGREDSNETTEVGSSSASTARMNPTVTAKVTSSKSKTKAGWYSRPVTVRFTCKPGSDAVTSCPKPVTVGKNGVTTVSRTVMAKDGGVATVNVTVKVDRTRPTVTVSGVKNGRVYPTLPKIGCRASDRTSGIAGCVLTRTVGGGTTVTFVATATDRAGNTASKTVTVRRSPVLITGADYSGPIPVVKLGKGYTLVYTGKGKPSYVNAAPSPVKPKGDGGRFTKIGKNRWAYSVVFTKNLRGHSTWSFGVKIGKKTLIVKVKIKK